MAKIAIIWELGLGYGHLSTFPPLANALRKMGHDIVFITFDLMKTERFLGAMGYRYLQAPVNLEPAQPNQPSASNYTELLIRQHWLDEDSLRARIKAWLELFDLIEPDIAIFNHSPTALLAAHSTDIKKVQYGTGFECPDATGDSPEYAPWIPVQKDRLIQSERQLLTSINNTLASIDKPGITQVSDIFKTTRFICSFEQLDSYMKVRSGVQYYGPVNHTQSGASPIWPNVNGKRVFVYLKPDFKGLGALFQALKHSGLVCLLHIPGLSDNAIEKAQTKNLRFSKQPVNLDAVVKTVDFVICNGGHGTICQFLQSGRPLLIMPAHAEQWVNLQLMARLEVAVELKEQDSIEGYHRAINQIVGNRRYHENAARVSELFREQQKKHSVKDIARQIDQLK